MGSARKRGKTKEKKILMLAWMKWIMKQKLIFETIAYSTAWPLLLSSSKFGTALLISRKRTSSASAKFSLLSPSAFSLALPFSIPEWRWTTLSWDRPIKWWSMCSTGRKSLTTAVPVTMSWRLEPLLSLASCRTLMRRKRAPLVRCRLTK